MTEVKTPGPADSLGAIWDCVSAFWNTPTSNAPTKRWRVGLGLVTAAFHLSWVLSAPLISGDGVIAHTPWGRIASVPKGETWWLPMAIAALGMAAAITLTTGRLLRISAPVLAMCTLSLLSYQPHARNAGDLLIGSWAVLTAIYSVAWPTLPWRYRAERTEISPWLRRMVLCQLSIIYLASAAHKLAARDWRDGAAVGFALRYADNLWLGASSFVLDRPWLNAVASWGTIALEVGIVVLLWRPKLQKFGVVAAIALHMGIAVVFDVGLFSPAMLIGLVVVPDSPRWWRRDARLPTAPG